MAVFWGILGLLAALIVFLKLVLRIVFYEGTLWVSIRAGPFKFGLYPRKPTRQKTRKQAVSPKKKRIEPLPKEKQKIQWKALLPMMRTATQKLWNALKIRRFALHICLTADDASRLAVRYGQLHIALGLLYPHIYKKFDESKSEIRIWPDFEATASTCDFALECSLRIRKILATGFTFLYEIIKQKKGGQL